MRNDTTAKTFCLFSALAVLGLIAGCDSKPSKPAPQPPPSQPAPQNCPAPSEGETRHVPIGVIRVLYQQGGGGAGDSPGSPTNAGCRLTDQQINAYIEQARTAFLSSLNVSLDAAWRNGDQKQGVVINDLHWAPGYYPVRPRQERELIEFIFYELHVSQKIEVGLFDPNKLNIFFAGNIKVRDDPDAPLRTVNANTIDPWSAAYEFETNVPHPDQTTFPDETFVMRPFLFVNDRGGNTGQPKVVLTDNVLEHELTHWFLRQTQGQGGRYDAAEHIPCPPSGPCDVPYIMKEKTPHPLKWDDRPGICESYEVWTKARTPDWNQP